MVLLHGKVTLKVAALVQDAGHLDYAIVAIAIQEEMPRLLHARPTYSVPAELQVIRASAFDHYVRACS